MSESQKDDLTKLDLSKLNKLLQPSVVLPKIHSQAQPIIVVFSKHRYYRHLVVELYRASYTKTGKLKNPLIVVDPLDLIWKTNEQQELKFYAGVSRFKNNYNEERDTTDQEALQAILQNPMKLDFYIHDEDIGATVTANSLILQKFALANPDVLLDVNEKDDYFAISGKLKLGDKKYALQDVVLRFNYFVQVQSGMYLITNPHFLKVIDFFKQHRNSLVIDRPTYEDFQKNVLSILEAKIKINYAYLKKATSKQRIEQGFDLDLEQLIYLSESEDFVLLTPVMRYGSIEIPIISKKQIRAKDKTGKFFTVSRDTDRELQFLTTIGKMHPYFEEQLEEFSEQLHADCFYIHRKHFLEPSWFLEAFAVWRNKGIAILGFNELKDNKLSAYQAEISVNVISGIDWFETAIKIKFDKETVSLKHLHKSIRNKNRFVQLDDGTIGVLPQEWLDKFRDYFEAATVIDDKLHTPKINFASVAELYEIEMMDLQTREQLAIYKDKLGSFESMENIPVPDGLNADLRPYQKEGLNWLNFLDSFNFGGCLADDMGLGKTIQIIAFILSQRKQGAKNVNLIVVPASLVFNWQQEIKKFAPSIHVKTLYGSERKLILKDLAHYEIVLTSYSTLLSDVHTLKSYRFNYIFLDESQQIKNPDSQRYKAVRLLQSRNKIAITGTPIENSTYDLYGQLSFACPGLLGTKEQFKRLYSVPIDQFKDVRRSEELRKRIYPFILRRTKEQVAEELPDKTEMVIYCEMGQWQREIYNSCRTEIRDYLMGTAADELKKSSMHVLKGITKLRQICDSPALFTKDNYYRNASAKLDVLLEQIEAKVEHHKILVFSQFVGMLDLIKSALEDRLIPFAYLSGQTRNREGEVNRFQKQQEVKVFLISLKAGGIGLNLTQADYVFLVDPWWNPAVENQAIDRSYRIGQHQNVMAVRLICPDTIEEKMMQMQSGKKDLASNLVRTDTSIFKSLSKADLLALI